MNAVYHLLAHCLALDVHDILTNVAYADVVVTLHAHDMLHASTHVGHVLARPCYYIALLVYIVELVVEAQ